MTVLYTLAGIYAGLHIINLLCKKFRWGNEITRGLYGFMFRKYFYPGSKKREFSNSLSLEMFTDSRIAFGISLRFGHFSESISLCIWLCGGIIIISKFPDLFEKIMPRYLCSRDYGFSFSKSGTIVFSNGMILPGGTPVAYTLNVVDLILGAPEYTEGEPEKEGKTSILLPEGEYKAKYVIFPCTYSRKRWRTHTMRRFKATFKKPIPMPTVDNSSQYEDAIASIVLDAPKGFKVSEAMVREFLEIKKSRKEYGGPLWVPQSAKQKILRKSNRK